MRQGELCYREHLDDVRLEYVFHCVEVDLREVAAHVLLRGVVDEDVDVSVSSVKSVPGLLHKGPQRKDNTAQHVYQQPPCTPGGLSDLQEPKDTPVLPSQPASLSPAHLDLRQGGRRLLHLRLLSRIGLPPSDRFRSCLHLALGYDRIMSLSWIM